MSFDTEKYQGFDVDGLLAPHAQALLRGFPEGVTEAAYKAIEPILGRDNMIGLLDTYEGNVPNIFTFQGMTVQDGEVLSRIANAVRLALLGLPVTGYYEAFKNAERTKERARQKAPAMHPAPSVPTLTPSGAAQPAFPPPTPATIPNPSVGGYATSQKVLDALVEERRATKVYPCKDANCGEEIEGLVLLYLHHINFHRGGWAFRKLEALAGYGEKLIVSKRSDGKYFVDGYVQTFEKKYGRVPNVKGPGITQPGQAFPAQPARQPSPLNGTTTTVSATFTPKYNLDLRGIPDGRYAVKNNNGQPVFLIKRTTKRSYYRAGRFVWGRARYNGQTIPIGTLELRLQAGDTKKLVGEQKPTDGIYFGDLEDEVKELMRDPVAALQLYGILMQVCAYCGRSLTDPESRARGIGPDCWEQKHKSFSFRAHLARVGVNP